MLSPEEKEDLGYFEGQRPSKTTEMHWEGGRAQLHSHHLPPSTQPGGTWKMCPHDVIVGLASK